MSLYIYKAEVTRVVDGDTVDCEVDLGFGITSKMRFRLLDIDTAETWRPKTDAERAHGTEATNWLKLAVEGQAVIIKTDKDKRGKYRWLCRIYNYDDHDLTAIADGRTISINEEMIGLGFEKRDSYID